MSLEDFCKGADILIEKASTIDGTVNPSVAIGMLHKLDALEHELRRITVKMTNLDKIEEQTIIDYSQNLREAKSTLVRSP